MARLLQDIIKANFPFYSKIFPVFSFQPYVRNGPFISVPSPRRALVG